jgi:hypothetical protein
MARRPKRSGIAAKLAAFIDLAPVRAARTFLDHIGLALVRGAVIACDIFKTTEKPVP